MPVAVFSVGDWVRFYRNGTFEIGVVEYVRKQGHYPHDIELLTDKGGVSQDSVIESRKPSPSQDGAGRS